MDTEKLISIIFIKQYINILVWKIHLCIVGKVFEKGISKWSVEYNINAKNHFFGISCFFANKFCRKIGNQKDMYYSSLTLWQGGGRWHSAPPSLLGGHLPTPGLPQVNFYSILFFYQIRVGWEILSPNYRIEGLE